HGTSSASPTLWPCHRVSSSPWHAPHLIAIHLPSPPRSSAFSPGLSLRAFAKINARGEACQKNIMSTDVRETFGLAILRSERTSILGVLTNDDFSPKVVRTHSASLT
ncbi:hypothetical protein BC826DRAFT_982840, partial [Russula brevipes]